MITLREYNRKIYELMDSFLVEGDKPRRIEQLNEDRHLFVNGMLRLMNELIDEMIECDDLKKYKEEFNK